MSGKQRNCGAHYVSFLVSCSQLCPQGIQPAQLAMGRSSQRDGSHFSVQVDPEEIENVWPDQTAPKGIVTCLNASGTLIR